MGARGDRRGQGCMRTMAREKRSGGFASPPLPREWVLCLDRVVDQAAPVDETTSPQVRPYVTAAPFTACFVGALSPLSLALRVGA